MAKNSSSSHLEPGDDNGGLLGVPRADDPAGDDHGAAEVERGDDKGGLAGGQGADDPAGHHHFSFTDTATHTSGSDDGTVYTGPVTYLQHEYRWSGHDGRAVNASVPNAFIHGGD